MLKPEKHEYFLDPKSYPQNHQPCTCPDTYLVGPGGSELFSTVGPKLGSVGPGGSQLFSTWDPNRVRWDTVEPGESQPFSMWDPTPRLGFTMLIRVRRGPMIIIFTVL